MLAQIPLPPGFDEAIAAASNRNWEAVVLVVLILSGFSFFGYMFRRVTEASVEREMRLSGRVTHLEELIRERLFTTIDTNAQIVMKMIDATTEIVAVCREMREMLGRFELILENRPCMAMDAAARAQLVDALVKTRSET